MNLIGIDITHKGKAYVAIPKAMFTKLRETLEDMEDYAYASEVRGEVESGEMETFPLKFVKAKLAAKTSGKKLTLWRKYRGYNKSDLGKAVGVSGQFISMIEAGNREGSIALFKKIAHTLNCTIDDLV